jgi:hypothetical protein
MVPGELEVHRRATHHQVGDGELAEEFGPARAGERNLGLDGDDSQSQAGVYQE